MGWDGLVDACMDTDPPSPSLPSTRAVRKRRSTESGGCVGELSVAALLERRRVLLAECSDDGWRVFARQEEALQALHSGRLSQSLSQPHPSAALHLFSHELSGSSGAREFIVASYASFYRRYMALHARHRHHYGHCSTHTRAHNAAAHSKRHKQAMSSRQQATPRYATPRHATLAD